MSTDNQVHDADMEYDVLPEPRKRRTGMIVALAILVIFGVGVWYAYHQGVQRGGSLVPPLIKAQQGPIKVPPENPGGMQVPNQDVTVYDRIGNPGKSEKTERLLPPPEQPKPEAPPPPKVSATVAVPQVVAIPQPPSGAAATAPLPPGTPSPPASETLDKPVTALPAAPPTVATVPAVPPTVVAVPAKPPTVAAAAPAPAAPAAAKPAAPPAAAGAYRIQLGAYRDRPAADEAWLRLQKQYADVLAGLNSTVVRADLGAKGVFQRLQAGPLADRAAAQAACEKLKVHKQGCLVVAP